MRLRKRIAAASVLAIVATLTTAAPASSYPGAPWFEAGTPYDQNFPDPSILLVGDTYYAYGTNTGGVYMPTMSSLDQVSWTARQSYSPNPYNQDPYFNDALPDEPSWALQMELGHPHLSTEILAPGVAKVGDSYVAYSTVRVAPTSGDKRYCIGVARASAPTGPFVNQGDGPLQCDSDPVGSIDPDPFIDGTGTPYLIWKSEGVPGSVATRIWSRQLQADGLGFARGSSASMLLATGQGWEGNVVENPSMVQFGGRYILFYSGNEWRSGDYRTGYAFCDGPTGPCGRPASGPLLGNTSQWLGPGGADAFVDGAGRLRLAFHAWNAPYTDYPSYPACQEWTEGCSGYGQRFLRFTTLYVDGTGKLAVGESAPPDDGRRFYVSNNFSGGNADAVFTYGRIGDEVFVGDWDGDRDDTLAVRRGNTFYVNNALSGGAADTSFGYGRARDEVFVGDWDGDGNSSFAVRRGRTFYVTNSLRGGTADTTFTYGRDGDEALVGDWDGDGRDSFAVRRGNVFYVSNALSGGSADGTFSYGRNDDEVLVGDWDADGDDAFGVRRGNVFYLSYALRSGTADSTFGYGRASDAVHVGDWNGNGIDTFTVRR